jgi:glycine/serine hydroxymethyltransferase
MDEPEMREIAGIIGEVIKAPEDGEVKRRARERVADLCARFPAYP